MSGKLLSVLFLLLLGLVVFAGWGESAITVPATRYKPAFSAVTADLSAPATYTALSATESGILTGIRLRVLTLPEGAAAATLNITLDGQLTTLTLYGGSTVWTSPAQELRAHGSGNGSGVGDVIDIPLHHPYTSTATVTVIVSGGTAGLLSAAVVRGVRF